MASFEIGTVFQQRYRLERPLGTSGFAEVWKVADTMADTQHALKVFAPGRGLSAEGLERFKRDYQLSSRLRHPHLLTATHFGLQEGSPYLVMPLCEQGSLEGHLRQGPLPEQEVARVLAHVAEALAYLHGLTPAVLHGDVKTDNILIGNDGQYLLSDFGITPATKQALAEAIGAAQATDAAYAAPECFQTPPSLLPASDIFSLGVTLYELCEGEVPWEGNGGWMLGQGAPVPALPPSYSPGLNAVVQACLNPLPHERPQARQLRDWAEAYLRGQGWPGGSSHATAASDTSSARKTQRMEDVLPPVSAGRASDAPHGPDSKAPSGQHQGGQRQSDDKPPGKGLGRALGLVLLLLLATGGYWGFSRFAPDAPEPAVAETGQNQGAEPAPGGGEDAPPPKPAETSKPAETAAKPKPEAGTAKPKEAAALPPYRPAGSLEAAFARLATAIPYSERQRVKQEMMGYFSSPQALVITQVNGIAENAEEAQAFAARIITLPTPKIKVLEADRQQGKVQKLIVEID